VRVPFESDFLSDLVKKKLRIKRAQLDRHEIRRVIDSVSPDTGTMLRNNVDPALYADPVLVYTGSWSCITAFAAA